MVPQVVVAAALCVVAMAAGTLSAKAKPNIVLFLCDDMDYTLGAWTPMKQTTKIYAEKVCVCAIRDVP